MGLGVNEEWRKWASRTMRHAEVLVKSIVTPPPNPAEVERQHKDTNSTNYQLVAGLTVNKLL